MSTTKRRSTVFVAGVAAVLGFVYACSFPDPVILESVPDGETAEASAEAATEGGAFDVTATDVNSLDQNVLIDGADPDALIVTDAGVKVDADPNCLASNADCDCDNDGFNRPDCGASAGENDCDDTDQRIRPDQGFLEIANPPRNGDWNCKNGIEKLYAANVTCKGLALGPCKGINGFQGDPACGASAPYVFCGVVELLPPLLGLACDVVTTQTRTQACK